MINALILILVLGYVNPADPTGTTMYPSGIKECDKTIFNAPPASKKPFLRLSFPVYDTEKRYISPSIYEMTISPKFDMLFFIESNKIIGKLPVTEYKILPQLIAVPNAEIIESNANYTIIYKKDFIEAKSIIEKEE